MAKPGIFLAFNLMKTYERILLASHGTKGARAADTAAISLCASGAAIDHLEVVPDLWKGMMGDDWLNNASTRDIFGSYVESELGREVQQHINKLENESAKKGIRYNPIVVLGKPAESLLEQAGKHKYDLVVIGSPRPRGETGLRSRMHLDTLARGLSIPILIVPYPQ